MRELVEAGLREVLSRADPIPAYTLPDLRAGKRGDPFMPGFDPAHWSKVREFLYAGRMRKAMGLPPEESGA